MVPHKSETFFHIVQDGLEGCERKTDFKILKEIQFDDN